MSPTELLVLALAIAVASTTYFGALRLARRFGVPISMRWNAEGWPLLALAGVALIGAAVLPVQLLVAAVTLGAANGGIIALVAWYAARKLNR